MSATSTIAVVLAASIACLYAWRADFARYSIFTVGVFKRVERTPVADVEYECADLLCEQQTERAERRRWYKEAVLAGMPVVRYGGGVAHYCSTHVSFELHGDLQQAQPTTTTERLAEPVLQAIYSVVLATRDEETSTPFDDVTTTMSSVFQLAPALLVVLFAALIIGSVERGIDGGDEA